ncbi:glycosyltransferase [Sphingomonas lutea]|uniref:Glycosyltransferase n=1 Tax=Sphingomonas lutea TaxID=1045317 RepID=A0A7G9SEW4_9SPHN|nr:glycosyltransferase [Sphingomonas lutea]QNN66389.1 glycosyltransferase [Sphingomonas lutea]
MTTASPNGTSRLPRLSICIPTYNFGQFIGETLNSIIPQLTDEVEVVVVDGASTDETELVVREFQRLCPAIRYVKLPQKGGIDRDMATAVELAEGDYCWLFSADDIMFSCAIRTALNCTRGGDDVYLCTHGNSGFDLTLLAPDYPAFRRHKRSRFELDDPESRRRYFALAATSEAFFSFMGTIILKRAKWRSVPLNEEYVGTCWAHAARLLAIGKTSLTVTYLAEPLLTRRDGNDSFAGGGVVKRFALAIDGYNRIAEDLYGRGSEEAKHVQRVIRGEFGIRHFLWTKELTRQQPARESREELDRLAKRNFRNGRLRGNVEYLVYRLLPAAPVSLAIKAFRSARAQLRRLPARQGPGR